MRRMLICGIILLGLLAALLVPALAEDGTVMMGDYLLLRIRCASGGYTASERAAIIQKRANDLLVSGGVDLSTVHTVTKGTDVAIYVEDMLFITADKNEAKANKTTPQGLANVWVSRLKEIYPLALPKTVNGKS